VMYGSRHLARIHTEVASGSVLLGEGGGDG
jgi:hypothetical protein